MGETTILFLSSIDRIWNGVNNALIFYIFLLIQSSAALKGNKMKQFKILC